MQTSTGALLLLLLSSGLACASDPFQRAIGGPFELIDQYGNTRSEVDPDGHAQLLFFGYANCPDICTAALPLMAHIVDKAGAAGIGLRPVMITVDPARDTPQTMGPPMQALHPDFIGLTGTQTALSASYAAFEVDVEPLFQDPGGQWIYAHGSFIYLLDAKGGLLTLLPPILGADEAARIVLGYLRP